MNKHPYQTLALDNGGSIILTPCPGTHGRELTQSISDLAQENTNIILTLMFDEEMSENKLQLLPQLCKQADILWLQLPIIDDDIPDRAFERQWQLHSTHLLNTLNNGGCITIHCKGGTGRTGMIAAMLLTCLGYPIDKTIKKIQNVRPNALRNKDQLAYVVKFAETLIKNR